MSLVNMKSSAMLVFILFFFRWRKSRVLPLFLSRQSASISFHTVQKCPICICPFLVLVRGVSPHLFLFSCSMCQWGCYLRWCICSMLDTSVMVYCGRHGPYWLGRRPIPYDMFVGFHPTVINGQGTTWRSPSLSRSTTFTLSSLWNNSAHLALVFELWRHLCSDAVLAQAIWPITGRLVEGGSVFFLPVQLQRICPLPMLYKYQNSWS